MNKSTANSLLPVPAHVAIIMDGNGRWAQQRGLPRTEGHREGAKNAIALVDCAGKLGVKVMTLYAFSTENWKRPISEVTAIMKLLASFVDEHLPSFQTNQIRLRVAGDLLKVPLYARKKVEKALDETQNNTGATLVIALNYGGRAELTEVCRRIVREKIPVSKIDEACLARHLYVPDVPDPELMIRTGGDSRISNFLLWQCAYAELFFVPEFFPDFGPEHLTQVIDSYRKRDRRFGALSSQSSFPLHRRS